MTDGDAQPPAGEGWRESPGQGFIGLVGPFWVREAPDGSVRYGFRARDHHANHLGVVQGGMLMTFADRALGNGAWAAAGDAPCSTIQFSMNFVNAAQIGGFIEVAPRVTRATRSVVFMEGRLTASGVELATAQGVWKVVWRGSLSVTANTGGGHVGTG